MSSKAAPRVRAGPATLQGVRQRSCEGRPPPIRGKQKWVCAETKWVWVKFKDQGTAGLVVVSL